MDRHDLRKLLAAVQAGALPVDQAVERIARPPVDELGFARLDTHRLLRTGDPEVIFGQGKSAQHIAHLLERLARAGQVGLATRVDADKGQRVLDRLQASLDPDQQLHYDPVARILRLRRGPAAPGVGHIVVACAGTSDLPVAEEAAVVAEALGNHVDRVSDIGVAGIHRTLAHADVLRRAHAVIVVAGMEGALASVVAGLVACPVIAVPTSVGYGASFGGLAALLGMLNSCAAGVSVVNIDNGFGAAVQASRINRLAVQAAPADSAAEQP